MFYIHFVSLLCIFWTNLLTRCHSVSSLFSAVFGSRKVLLRIFSELHETKGHVPIFPTRTRSPKEKRRGARRWPNHMAARQGVGPRLCVVWPPPGSSSSLSFGLRVRAGKIGTWPFVSCNFENISRSNFLKQKTAENRELALWHLVNRLVPENA